MKLISSVPAMTFLLITLLFACGNDDNADSREPIALIISNLVVTDIAENGNGSDIGISFNKISDESEVLEYRVYVVKSNNSAGFDVANALSIALPNYSVIEKTGANISTTLMASATDVDGDIIVEEVSYTIFVVAVAESSSMNFSSGISSGRTLTLTMPSASNIVSNLNSGFSASGGLLVGPDGAIYIANFGTGTQNGTKILRFTSDGSNYEEFADGLLGPTGGAFDSNGNLYWSSYSGNRVHKIDSNGNLSNLANIPGPVGIAIDNANNLYVASCDGNDIKKINSEGIVTTYATSTSFNCPNGLTIDDNGTLYCCNFEDGRIFSISNLGEVNNLTSIRTNSSVNMVYRNGYLYVTGRNGHAIYKVSASSGEVETFAGTGIRGNVNGPALMSEFSFPNGLDFSLDGKYLYVNDVDPNSGTNSNGLNFNPNILRAIEITE